MPEMPDLNIVSLDKLQPGEEGVIQGYSEARELHQRLKELGLVKGTRVKVRRCAPWGDPIELAVRGYHLSIRKQDAKYILVLKETASTKEQGPCGRFGNRFRWGQKRHQTRD